jgi:hypothetical protein
MRRRGGAVLLRLFLLPSAHVLPPFVELYMKLRLRQLPKVRSGSAEASLKTCNPEPNGIGSMQKSFLPNWTKQLLPISDLPRGTVIQIYPQAPRESWRMAARARRHELFCDRMPISQTLT